MRITGTKENIQNINKVLEEKFKVIKRTELIKNRNNQEFRQYLTVVHK